MLNPFLMLASQRTWTNTSDMESGLRKRGKMGVWDWITHHPTYEEVRMWDMDSLRYNVVIQLLKVHG